MRALLVVGSVLLGALPLAFAGPPSVDAQEVVEVRALDVFPIEGDEYWYSADFLAPRGGGTRLHQGVDIFTDKHVPLLAVRDAVVDRLGYDGGGLSGNFVVLVDDDGWEYVYVHLNNDTPGTDDGANERELIAPLEIEVGARVEAGDVVGYNGDSGNAETTPPHLHFEIRRPDGTRLNPFPSLQTSLDLPVGDRCTWSSNPDWEPDDASGLGYWTADAAGVVTPHGAAPEIGGLDELELNEDVLGMTPTRTGLGYWMVAADGGIFSFGDAAFHGSTGSLVLNEPVMGMAALPEGDGYWLVAADGGIFAFGETEFFGSMGGAPLNEPVVGMVPTATGDGYLLVARDGGIFAFGDAEFFGSLPGIGVDASVVAVAVAPDGGGYWILTRAGGIYPFGDVEWHGSVQASGHCLDRQAVAIAPSATGEGYWILTDDGRVWPFGDAVDFEVAASAEQAVAIAAVPPGAELPEPEDEAAVEETTTTTTTTTTTLPPSDPSGEQQESGRG
ncbi:MAG: M23 family metallopeptidase [Actinomycetota bacterium]